MSVSEVVMQFIVGIYRKSKTGEHGFVASDDRNRWARPVNAVVPDDTNGGTGSVDADIGW